MWSHLPPNGRHIYQTVSKSSDDVLLFMNNMRAEVFREYGQKYYPECCPQIDSLSVLFTINIMTHKVIFVVVVW